MKRIFFAVFVLSAVYFFASCKSTKQKQHSAADSARKYFYIMDNANVFDSIQQRKLNELYLVHEEATTNQIALLSTDSYFPDSTIDAYSLRQANAIGAGRKDINNGVLIVLNVPMHGVRIELGKGTAKVFSNSFAQKIIDSLMIPQFKQQKYFEGIWEGSLAISNFLEKPENKIK